MTNQYRCETCENKEPIPTPRWASETPLRLGDRCKITKKKCKKKFTSGVGCASHSNFKAEKKAEKILDELILEINRVSLTGFTKYTYRRWVLDKLRREGKVE